jgi:hypothetical protein
VRERLFGLSSRVSFCYSSCSDYYIPFGSFRLVVVGAEVISFLGVVLFRVFAVY